MNFQTARTILGFPSKSNKLDVDRNRTHPKYAIRYAPTSKQSKQRIKKKRIYLKRQVQPIEIGQTPFESSIQAEVNQLQDNYFEIPQKISEHHLSHPLIQKKGTHLSQIKSICSTQSPKRKENRKKIQVQAFDWPRISQTDHQIKLEKQEKDEEHKNHSDYRFHIFRRPTLKVEKVQNQKNKAKNEQLTKQKYYISDIKKSVHQYMNNRQYMDNHLEHFMDSISAFEMNPYLSLPKEVTKAIDLPISDGKVTIVFDLDETLVHTQVVNQCSSVNSGDWGSIVDISTEYGDYFVNLKIRPHAVEVLNRLKEKFELGIFTASQTQYGNTILAILDPQSTIFSFKLFRHHCFELHSRINHVKDLRILKNRDPAKIILIDNSPQAYIFQKNNAVPIIPFINDDEDTELLKLQIFLNSLSDAKDVRPILKDYFKLEQYHNYKNIFRLVKQLY